MSSKVFDKKLDNLPDVLKNIIYSYIPKYITIILTKSNYIEDHCFIRCFIKPQKKEQYIRDMICRDNDFVFKYLLFENYNRWLNMKKYYYKECIYTNYLYFLEYYAEENNSDKCLNLIEKFLEEQGLSKNQHKKKIFNYIRWKN